MAITEAQVHAAAARLDQEGRKVTVLAVRDALGAGSYTTIQKYLRTYEGEPAGEAAEIPDDLRPIFQGVWGRAVQLAQEQASVEVSKANAERDALIEERAQLVAALDAQEAETKRLRRSLSQCEKERKRLFGLLEALKGPGAES